MADLRKEVNVFDRVTAKLAKYDKQPKSTTYNSAYHKILNARAGESCLVNEDGSVDEASLQVVEQGLLAFDMGVQMDETFIDKLRKKLNQVENKKLLRTFRGFSILSPNIEDIKSETENFFFNLSDKGEDCLSSDNNRFGVGATKIMNFLFPDLFVIADSNVRNGLHQINYLDFKVYWAILMLCHNQLIELRRTYGDFKRLLRLDKQPTTLVRIFDKCAFVMGRFKSRV